MVEKKHTRLVRRRMVTPVAGCGPLYCWSWTHYDQLVWLRDVARRPWRAIMLDMAEDGVSSARSIRLTEKNVRDTWQRVAADVRILADAQAALTAARPPRPPVNQPPLAAVQPLPFRSQEVLPTFRTPASSPLAEDVPAPDFPTVDPSGNPLPDGKVFYAGRVVSRVVAEMKDQLLREFREMDRASDGSERQESPYRRNLQEFQDGQPSSKA